jgi:hypothetical protein
MTGVTAIAKAAGPLAATVVIALSLGIEIKTATATTASPPYQNCSEARADGRSSIPYTDPAYRPELDLDSDGLACEPGKPRRSTR